MQEHLDKYRIGYEIKNSYMTILESRPSTTKKKKWISLAMARIRFISKDLTWVLYWIDSNEKGHLWKYIAPTVNLKRVLKEIEKNRYGAFFG